MLSQIGDILKFLAGGLCTGYNNIYRILWVLMDTLRPVGKNLHKNPTEIQLLPDCLLPVPYKQATT